MFLRILFNNIYYIVCVLTNSCLPVLSGYNIILYSADIWQEGC